MDCVVFATGWKTGYDFLPDEVRAALNDGPDGFYLYRHILHPNVPDLAFVGRASSFMSVTTYALQAKWLASVLSGQVPLPPADTMSQMIDDLASWKRSWMPDGPARSATLLLHMAPYHDELVSDLGQDPLRKKGLLAPLKELLVPYNARDYREVV